MRLTEKNMLTGHTSEETAYLVDDYPYGYSQRTQIRYWLENSAKHGDRFVSQTLNPKTGRWNKPKKSTYCLVGAMFMDDDNHVTWTGIGLWSKADVVAEFVEITREHLSPTQLNHVAEIVATQRVMEGVTYSIHEGERTPEEELEQARIERVISNRIANEVDHARAELECEQ